VIALSKNANVNPALSLKDLLVAVDTEEFTNEAYPSCPASGARDSDARKSENYVLLIQQRKRPITLIQQYWPMFA